MPQPKSNLVYFDGYCPFCSDAARLIERLDWLGKFEVVSFRHDDSFLGAGVTMEALEREMHVVAAGRVSAGFDAVMAISTRLPLLWPLVPAFWFAKLTGIGGWLYRFLAERRIIVADGSSCASAPAGECGAPPTLE